MEDHDVVDTVQELRAEVLLQLVIHLGLHPLVLRSLVLLAGAGEAHAHGLGDIPRTQVRGEDQHCVLEVHDAALAIGQATFLQHLEQRIVDVLIGLLHLVEQHDGERLAADLPSAGHPRRNRRIPGAPNRRRR